MTPVMFDCPGGGHLLLSPLIPSCYYFYRESVENVNN